MKKRILITGVLVALIMFVFILMGKKIVNSIWFKTQWDINFPFVESYYTVDGMWESYNIYLCSENDKKDSKNIIVQADTNKVLGGRNDRTFRKYEY